LSLTVEERFSWTGFAERYWDRRPVLFRSVSPLPFDEQEVFDAAVPATRPVHPLAMPPNVQFTIERRQQTQPGAHLPQPADGSFDGYCKRLAEQLEGQRYALVVHGFHGFHFPQWARERVFYAGLWEHVGQPLTGGITTLFHGTYEHSPVGVHRDRFATFMFGLRGRKRMRFWAERPWSEPVTSVLDYQPYVADSFTADVAPGQLLYWPATFYHVGENAGAEPATSVNVGVPREEHRSSYDLDDILIGADRGSLADAGRALLPDVDAALFTPDGQPPAALEQAVELLLHATAEVRLRDRLTELSLRHATAGGFRPVPPPAETRHLPDHAVLLGCARILTADSAGTTVCAANGHMVRTLAAVPELARLLHPLHHGAAVTVAELLKGWPDGLPGADGDALPATREGIRRLLEAMESFRAVDRQTG
jgi:50S ribosomal protein L16 3-hydroxylase